MTSFYSFQHPLETILSASDTLDRVGGAHVYGALPPEAEGEPGRLQCVATRIEQVQRSAGLARREQIGAIVLSEIFRGSRLAWQARSSAQHLSFRALSRLLSGKLSKSELHRCVNTHLLCQDLPHLVRSGCLTVSHLDAVEGLSRGEQAQLLERAMAERLSVRELARLKQSVKEDRRDASGNPSRGRPKFSFEQRFASESNRLRVKLQRLRAQVARAGLADTVALRRCVEQLDEEVAMLRGLVDSFASDRETRPVSSGQPTNPNALCSKTVEAKGPESSLTTRRIPRVA